MSSDNPYRDQPYPGQENPYASPPPTTTPHAPAPATVHVQPGLWREGNTVIASIGTEFPNRCVKCNAPANGYRLKRNYSWHHPAIYLLIIPGILVYAIVALILRKQARFYVGLCPRHKGRRLIWATVFSLAAIGSLLFLFSGCFLGDFVSADMLAIMIISGLLLFLFSLIAVAVATSVLRPKKIDSFHAWLKGAGKEFLQTLPPVN